MATSERDVLADTILDAEYHGLAPQLARALEAVMDIMGEHRRYVTRGFTRESACICEMCRMHTAIAKRLGGGE